MKKKMGVLVLVFTLVLLVGCGSNNSAPSIDSDWEMVSVEVNGQTTSASDLVAAGSPLSTFESDGNDFTFTNNDKSHTGNLTEDNGVYTLNFDDTDTKMEATISGDVLTLKVVGIEGEFTFMEK